MSAVQRTAGSEDSARGGRLDTALLRLLRSLNPGSKATQRIQVSTSTIFRDRDFCRASSHRPGSYCFRPS